MAGRRGLGQKWPYVWLEGKQNFHLQVSLGSCLFRSVNFKFYSLFGTNLFKENGNSLIQCKKHPDMKKL